MPTLDRRALLTLLGLSSAAMMVPTGAARAQSAPRVPVVASFSILADLVRQVGGDRVEVKALVGPNGDAHVYQPTPADAQALASAKLVVVNGLGLEGWMTRLVKASGSKAPMAVATSGVSTIEAEDDHDHDAASGRKGGGPSIDPHAWQSIANTKIYVANIRDALAKADPDGAVQYAARAAAYTAELDMLEGEVKAAMARIPADRRRIITSHDAFGYFGKAYGIAFISPQGVSTESEASAKDVARIIRQIKASRIPAVFLENVSDPRLMDRIAKETGARIGGRLYSDALSAQDGPAGTYIDMMRSNIRELGAALSS